MESEYGMGHTSQFGCAIKSEIIMNIYSFFCFLMHTAVDKCFPQKMSACDMQCCALIFENRTDGMFYQCVRIASK
jgi:hypothetical protein